jgi:hypothetical protein
VIALSASRQIHSPASPRDQPAFSRTSPAGAAVSSALADATRRGRLVPAYDRIVVAAATSQTDGLRLEEVAWLLEHAASTAGVATYRRHPGPSSGRRICSLRSRAGT